MYVVRSIFYRTQLKIITFYNLIWTLLHTLKCKRSGHDLDSQKLINFKKLVFCKRPGCKYSFIQE